MKRFLTSLVLIVSSFGFLPLSHAGQIADVTLLTCADNTINPETGSPWSSAAEFMASKICNDVQDRITWDGFDSDIPNLLNLSVRQGLDANSSGSYRLSIQFVDLATARKFKDLLDSGRMVDVALRPRHVYLPNAYGEPSYNPGFQHYTVSGADVLAKWKVQK